MSHPGPGGAWARDAQALAKRLGWRSVAVGEVAHLDAAAPDFEEQLRAVRENDLVATAPPASRPPGVTAHLQTPAEARALWREFPALLDANARVAADCRVDLVLGEPRFPESPLAPGETAYGKLHALCQAGLTRRYGTPPRAAARRLGEELDVIDRLGFTPYFLLVAEIVGFARAHAIPSVGRGSGAASLVSYVLGITNVDPVRYRLAFERFLHPARRDCPDLDIDLCWKRRDEVIAHVYATYGAERVAMISTHCTLGPRGALRETARIHGIAPSQVDSLSKLVPRDAEDGGVAAALATNPRARGIAGRGSPLARIVADAERLVGLPDHLGVHPGGLVIADTALTDYLPLEEATKGIVVSQYEMHAVEAVGLVKMDLLGNRALTEIGDCVALVGARTGTAPVLDPPPDGDAATANLVEAGDTLGVFQLESPGMRGLLRMMRSRSVDETIASVALIRPGPAGSGMKEAYIRRARGLETPRYAHPRLEPLLAPNYGVLLYEEDVMTVAAALADWSLAEGDLFRRAIAGARTAEERAPIEHVFRARLLERGIEDGVARAAWEDLARFAAYAFCKAHAAGYGVLAWQAAYCKSHWPAAFAVSLLAHHAGMYPMWVHVADAQRRGVRFLLPCVQRSEADAVLEGADPARGPVRLGLVSMRGLTQRTIERLIETRAAEGPFASLADLLARVRPTLEETLTLCDAGALDVLERTRASLRCEARATHARYRASEPEGMFRVRRSPVEVPEIEEFSARALRVQEWKALGVGVRAHPFELVAGGPRAAGEDGGLPALRAAWRGRGWLPAYDAERAVGQRARVAGVAAAWRRVETVRGERMLFLTLDDGTGIVECTLFPEAYRRAAPALRGGMGPYVAEGRFTSSYGAITLETERVGAWSPGKAATATNAVRQGGPAA